MISVDYYLPNWGMGKTFYLRPLSDWHLGSVGFNKERAESNVNWI